MSVTPPPQPSFKRVPPHTWTALAWLVGSALTFLFRFRLPGEAQPAQQGVLFFRWDGLAMLALATAVAVAGGRPRPPPPRPRGRGFVGGRGGAGAGASGR
ncbi:hypothetical protein ACFVZ2_37855, partial [Streptomyces lasiicapitis]